MAGEAERNAYLNAFPRSESDIATTIDRDAALASIAISLRRIADALTMPTNKRGESIVEAIGAASLNLRNFG